MKSRHQHQKNIMFARLTLASAILIIFILTTVGLSGCSAEYDNAFNTAYNYISTNGGKFAATELLGEEGKELGEICISAKNEVICIELDGMKVTLSRQNSRKFNFSYSFGSFVSVSGAFTNKFSKSSSFNDLIIDTFKAPDQLRSSTQQAIPTYIYVSLYAFQNFLKPCEINLSTFGFQYFK